jgi:hypothetical protein
MPTYDYCTTKRNHNFTKNTTRTDTATVRYYVKDKSVKNKRGQKSNTSNLTHSRDTTRGRPLQLQQVAALPGRGPSGGVHVPPRPLLPGVHRGVRGGRGCVWHQAEPVGSSAPPPFSSFNNCM